MNSNISDFKTGIIIQAHMSSTRLPGKVMLKLAGKPVLWHVVERCLNAHVGPVIVATSYKNQDDIIVSFCRRHHYPWFRGSDTHVLSRYFRCARKFKLDIIIRVTSDCPLIDPNLINQGLDQLLNQQADFFYSSLEFYSLRKQRYLPLGLDFDIFNFSALKLAQNQATTLDQLEGVDPYFIDHPEKFKPCTFAPPFPYVAPRLRLTLDEPADYKLLTFLFKRFYKTETGIDVVAIIKYLKAHPTIATINQYVKQKT